MGEQARSEERGSSESMPAEDDPFRPASRAFPFYHALLAGAAVLLIWGLSLIARGRGLENPAYFDSAHLLGAAFVLAGVLAVVGVLQGRPSMASLLLLLPCQILLALEATVMLYGAAGENDEVALVVKGGSSDLVLIIAPFALLAAASLGAYLHAHLAWRLGSD